MRKFILLLLLASISLPILGFNGNVVQAADDVLGIESGQYYYIRNVGTGKYLDVYNANDANGTKVWGYTGNWTDAQKWKAVLNSNGTYKFMTKCSITGRVLDVTGTKVDIWYDNGQSYQQFTLERINTTVELMSGTYYMKYQDKYISMDSSLNVTPTTLYQGANSAWSFEKVDKGNAKIFSNIILLEWIFIVPNYFNTRGADSYFKDALNPKGYAATNKVNETAANAYDYLKTDSVWVFIGMAMVTPLNESCATIAFVAEDRTHLGNITASRNLLNGSGTYAICDLGANELAQARCVLYLSSYTGEVIIYGTQKYGLAKNTYDRGAHFALGIVDLVDHLTATYYGRLFFEKAATSNTMTVRDCMEHADYGVLQIEPVNTWFVGDYNSRF